MSCELLILIYDSGGGGFVESDVGVTTSLEMFFLCSPRLLSGGGCVGDF